MFGLNKYTAKPPVLSDRAVGVCAVRGHRENDEMRWNEVANEGRWIVMGKKKRWRCGEIGRDRPVSRREGKRRR